MKLSGRIKKNTITPDLRRVLRVSEDSQKALRAAGTVVVSITKRSFNEPQLRGSAWKPLSRRTIEEKAAAGKSLAILKRDGVLFRSPRIVMLSRRKCIVGTDRFYARFQQLGTKRSARHAGIPARPFFPWDKNGRITPYAKARVRAAIKKGLGI